LLNLKYILKYLNKVFITAFLLF
jgi:hypothetical protein